MPVLFRVSLVLLAAASAASGGSAPMLDYRLRVDREPELGAEAETAAGESLYLEQSLPELPVATLTHEAQVTAGGERWSAGKVLLAVRIDGRRWFCDPALHRPQLDQGLLVSRAAAGETESRHLCVRDEDGDGAFDRVEALGYEPPERFAPVAYELGAREPVTPFSAKAFRRQLIYLGSGGGRLRVGYSEGVEDAGAPVSYGELDLEIEQLPGGSSEVGVRGVRIQVLEPPVDRARRLRYRVIRGFGGSGGSGADTGGAR